MGSMQRLAAGVLVWLGCSSGLAAPVFHLNPPRLPDATVGRAYTGGPLMVQGGGQCPTNVPSVRVVAGALPRGMYLSAGGEFGGAPAEAGRYEFIVRVQNGCGWSDQPMMLDVAGPALVLANPAALEFRVVPGQAVAPETIQVSSNVTGVAYTVDSSAPWLRARPKAGRTPAAGSVLSSDLIDIEIDTAALAPGTHRATVTLGGWRVAQPVTVPVRVEVLDGPAAALADPRIPRITMPAGAEPEEPALQAPLRPAPAAAHVKPVRPAATAPRLSRSAQLRSKYLASKPAPAPAPAATHAPAAAGHASPPAHGAPAPAATHAPAAAGHASPPAHGAPAAPAKPSPVGEAVKKPAAAHPPAAPAHAPAATGHDKPKEPAKH